MTQTQPMNMRNIEQRRAMMQEWADKLDVLEAGYIPTPQMLKRKINGKDKSIFSVNEILRDYLRNKKG